MTKLLTPGCRIDGATYAGICTAADGSLYALLLLDEAAQNKTWQQALHWAQAQAADLPTRPEAALLFSHLKPKLTPRAHWTNETCSWNASCAWYCIFFSGGQDDNHKSAELCARAVRRLVLQSFNSLVELAERAEAT